jgi:hypothetical protein
MIPDQVSARRWQLQLQCLFVCAQIVPLPFATDADVKARLTVSLKAGDNTVPLARQPQPEVRLAEDRKMITVEGLRCVPRTS